jgi:hypothetical protein
MSRTITINANAAVTLPWFTLWIFTIAFAHLSFGQGVLGLLIWPYYLGDAVATMVGR